MDHRAFVASLAPEVRAALTTPSDRAGLLHLSGHAGAIVLVGTLIAVGVPGWWAFIPVQGVLIVFLFTLEHEATHKTPFANPALNEWVGRVCGFLLLLPFDWFRSFHLAHHRWTNLEGKDPELETGKPETVRAWLWHVSGLPYWLASLRLIARLAVRRARADYLPDAALPRLARQARWMLAGYGTVVASLWVTPVLFWVWILPVLLGQPALRLYLLAEHGDCPRVASLVLNTRTTFTNRAMRFLAWNMPYHTEHHVYPQVPFHQLPIFHKYMKDHLKVTSQGYGAFNWAYLDRRRRASDREASLWR